MPGAPRRGGRAEHLDPPELDGQEAEDGAHQRRLAGAVRAEHADELALADRRS